MSKFTGEIADLDATVQMASEAMLSWLKQIDGYRGLLALANAEGQAACFMTFWDTEEARTNSRSTRENMRNQLAAMAGAEVLGMEEYSVIFTDEIG